MYKASSTLDKINLLGKLIVLYLNYITKHTSFSLYVYKQQYLGCGKWKKELFCLFKYTLMSCNQSDYNFSKD